MSATLGLIAPFAGKPTGTERTVTVDTSDPVGHFSVERGHDSMSLKPTTATSNPDLQLTTEALVRLVYGRLDPEHTPSFTGNQDHLALLQRTFTGV